MSNQNQKQIKPVYYFYGNDKYTLSLNLKKLLKNIAGENYKDTIEIYDGSVLNFDINALRDAMDAFPMGSEYNVILIENWNSEKKRAEENKKLNETVRKYTNDTTVLIFAAKNFDVCDGKIKPTAKNQKLIDAVNKSGGEVIICNIKSDTMLARDIQSIASKHDCKISRENAIKLANYNLCMTENAVNETEKLCAYVGKGEITDDVIEKLATKQESFKLYSLINVILKGDISETIHAYNILSEEMEPEQILFALTDGFINLYRAKTAAAERISDSDMQNDFAYRSFGRGVSFIVTNAYRDSRNLSLNFLRHGILTLCKTQYKLNSSSEINKKAVIERSLISILIK